LADDGARFALPLVHQKLAFDLKAQDPAILNPRMFG
jgi:hypothetical protein